MEDEQIGAVNLILAVAVAALFQPSGPTGVEATKEHSATHGILH